MKRAHRAHRPAPRGRRSARTPAPSVDSTPAPETPPTRSARPRAAADGACTFPAPTLPGGVAAPSILLLVVLLLCAAGLAVLGADRPGVPVLPALLPAAAVVTAAVVAPLALRLLVVRPVLRLRRAVAAPGTRSAPPRSRLREFDRIALGLRGSARPPARGSATLAVVAVLGAVAAGLGAVLAAVVTLTPAPSTELVADTRRATAAAAGEVRHTLQDGLAGLRSVAATTADDPAGLEAAATTALASRAVFRSVHAVDAAGTVLARAGAAPAVTGPPPEPGVRQLAADGAAPVVVAVAPVGADGAALVAEYDVRELNTGLDVTGAPTRVVDAELRTVLSSAGYLAFAPLVDPVLADVASSAHQTGSGSLSAEVGGAPSAVAAHRVGVSDEAADLGWVVLSHRGLTTAGFVTDPAARASAVVLAVAITAVLAVLAWTWVAALRPLRRLAGPAAAAGATRAPWRDQPGRPTPGPMPVQRLDEIGAVTAAVNRVLLRARSAAEPTTVFPRVTEPEPDLPRPRVPRDDLGMTRRLRRVLAAGRT